MIGRRIDELFGNVASERDGAACSRAEVLVAWGLVATVAATFACLSIVTRLPTDGWSGGLAQESRADAEIERPRGH